MSNFFLVQPYLRSGQNIKTVAGESLLGPGDVDVVTNEDLQAASLTVHPDSDDLLEITGGPAVGSETTITSGTSAPSGGEDGDIYLQYSL